MANKTINKDLENFKQALRVIIGDSIRKPISARLGHQDSAGVIYIKVPAERTDQPSKYYFHEAGGTSFQGEAFLQPGALASWQIRYNAPIRVKKDPLSGEWEIIGIDARYAAQFFNETAEDDNLIFGYSNIAPGLLTQTEPTSMKAKVLAGAYRYANTWRYYETQDTVDWSVSPYSSNIPTTNNKAKFVLVQLSFSDGSLSYKYGSEIPGSLTNKQAYTLNLNAGDDSILPALDEGYFRCGYIKLIRGMTKITSSGNIWAIQDYLTNGAAPGNILDKILVADGDVMTSDGFVMYATYD